MNRGGQRENRGWGHVGHRKPGEGPGLCLWVKGLATAVSSQGEGVEKTDWRGRGRSKETSQDAATVNQAGDGGGPHLGVAVEGVGGA